MLLNAATDCCWLLLMLNMILLLTAVADCC
jgi:hypothetical protein